MRHDHRFWLRSMFLAMVVTVLVVTAFWFGVLLLLEWVLRS